MKKTLLSIFLSGIFALPVYAQDAVTPEELSARLDVARQYSEIVSMEDEVKKSIDNIVIQVPKDDRVLYRSILNRNMNIDRLNTTSELALAEIFTKEELEAMVAFYGTPEGKAIRDKMPEYQERLKPLFEEMLRDSIESFQSQTR
jgi:hypothetical protein